MISVDDFKIEKDCVYKDEHYSVRDNGAVLRHPREGKRPRRTDNQWTFGSPNDRNYLTIGGEMVHRIVATAFHGEPPTQQYVVDHIDTNRHNNRPENLRWLTRLENVLCNPTTREKIESICGCAAEEFLENPALYREKFVNPNYAWMRRVTEEEAKNCLANMRLWTKKDTQSKGGTLGDWIFQKSQTRNYSVEWDFTESYTPNAIQKNWKTRAEFLCCPKGISDTPLLSYFENLKEDAVFCRSSKSTSFVSDCAFMEKDGEKILVLTRIDEDAVKPWGIVQITFEENLFVHTSIGTFFSIDGAKKKFTLLQGLVWNGESPIDDFL